MAAHAVYALKLIVAMLTSPTEGCWLAVKTAMGEYTCYYDHVYTYRNTAWAFDDVFWKLEVILHKYFDLSNMIRVNSSNPEFLRN